MTTSALMILGTSSHVGKSLITAALGRIFADEGLRVAPFKAQNMSLNSAATPDGFEIGRAQALQAEACRVVPRVEMNPVLIKPSSDTGAQVIVLGQVADQVTAADYHRRRVEELFPVVVESFRALAKDFELILLEGAGSPAEINLKARDIVNLRMAQAAGATCILVGDIDRGGVFASLLGTLELLEPDERRLIQGFVINKFRGDLDLLQPGIEMIERRIGIPCLGVVKYLADLDLEEEDSVSLESRSNARREWRHETGTVDNLRPLRIGVIAIPHLANFGDFDALAMEPSVSFAFLTAADEVAKADVVILPGSKQTLQDLEWLERTGFAESLRQFERTAQHRGSLIGICGGMQMLGRFIYDPAGAENDGVPAESEGLSLLPIETRLESDKITQLATGTLTPQVFGQNQPEIKVSGYEIHLGNTTYLEGAQPFAFIERIGIPISIHDGAVSASGSVWGTYLHGLFDADEFRWAFLKMLRVECGLAEVDRYQHVSSRREARINRWADHVRSSLNMNAIRSLIAPVRDCVATVIP